MAMLRERIAGRWPVAVLTAAVVAAVSLGDVVAGWYSWAGRGSSAPGEYPIRIVLRQPGRPAALPAPAPSLAAEVDEPGSDGAAPEAGPAAAAPEGRAGSEAPLARSLATDGLLAIRFDLADPEADGGGGSAIEIRKAVRLNGADAGEARIHVGASSRLSIAREELRRLLARSGRQELAEAMPGDGRYVSFDEIRRQGIEVRYDPVSDRILVST